MSHVAEFLENEICVCGGLMKRCFFVSKHCLVDKQSKSPELICALGYYSYFRSPSCRSTPR